MRSTSWTRRCSECAVSRRRFLTPGTWRKQRCRRSRRSSRRSRRCWAMPSEFRMPSLGPDMESGTLVAWQVKPGDTVKRGDVVAQVETDKGVIDVEIFAAGTVEKLLVEPGTHVPVGTVLAQLSGDEPTAVAPAVPERISQPEPARAAPAA